MTVVLIVYIAAMAGAAYAWEQPHRRTRRLLAKEPRKALAQMRENERVSFQATVLRANEMLASPLTGLVCVAYRFVVADWFRGPHPAIRYDHSVPFVVAADGVEAVVRGVVLVGLEPSRVDQRECPGLDDVLRQEGRERVGILGGERTFQCREALLRVGDEVLVLGRISVEVDPAGQRESLRGQPVRRIIRGEDRDPVVIALAPAARG